MLHRMQTRCNRYAERAGFGERTDEPLAVHLLVDAPPVPKRRRIRDREEKRGREIGGKRRRGTEERKGEVKRVMERGKKKEKKGGKRKKKKRGTRKEKRTGKGKEKRRGKGKGKENKEGGKTFFYKRKRMEKAGGEVLESKAFNPTAKNSNNFPEALGEEGVVPAEIPENTNAETWRLLSMSRRHCPIPPERDWQTRTGSSGSGHSP